jgi:acyl-CoA thioesterase FadM
MGATAERSFRVCRYECDLYGHLNNAHYLRYLDAVDEDMPSPCGSPVRIGIEFLKALEAGNTLLVTGESSGPRDGWEQRQYEFVIDQQQAARAEVEFLSPDGRDLGTPVAAAASQPEGTFRLSRLVEWRDVDVTGRVATAALASLAEDAGIRVCAAHEWPMTCCADEGFGVVLRRHEIELGVPMGLDHELEICTWASDKKRSMAIRHYLLRRVTDGAIAARFRSLYIWVSLESGRPIRIPQEFLASFAPNFSTDGASS